MISRDSLRRGPDPDIEACLDCDLPVDPPWEWEARCRCPRCVWCGALEPTGRDRLDDPICGACQTKYPEAMVPAVAPTPDEPGDATPLGTALGGALLLASCVASSWTLVWLVGW